MDSDVELVVKANQPLSDSQCLHLKDRETYGALTVTGSTFTLWPFERVTGISVVAGH